MTLVHCKLCGNNEMEYYVYYIIDNKYELIYCPSCANKSHQKICYKCGYFFGIKNEKFNYNIFKKGISIFSMCLNCINGNFNVNNIIKQKNKQNYEIGIYCGHCHNKKLIFNNEYYNGNNPQIIKLVNNIYIDFNSISFIKRFKKYRKLFKSIDGHKKWNKCNSTKCLIKKCKNLGWNERLGYCSEHMPKKKLRKKLALDLGEYTNLNFDLNYLIIKYYV